VLWIRGGVNADPDPAYYLNANPDPGSKTYADPDPGHTFPPIKVEFLHEKHTVYVGNVGSSLIVVGICSTKVVFACVTVNHTIPR
jgi:hypothetical protein